MSFAMVRLDMDVGSTGDKPQSSPDLVSSCSRTDPNYMLKYSSIAIYVATVVIF